MEVGVPETEEDVGEEQKKGQWRKGELEEEGSLVIEEENTYEL